FMERSGWAVSALQWAVGSGLLDTKDGDRLGAKDTVTQAEAAAVLARFDLLPIHAALLSSWVGDAEARNMLIEYMRVITDPNNEGYIPVEDRIAVFDLDGTLFCETDPGYFDHCLLYYRVMEDPDYKDKASDVEREVAERIGEYFKTGVYPSDMDMAHGKAVASAFAGMTLKEFDDYVQAFKQHIMPSYDGMLRGEGWYEPMLQVVDFLNANDFTVYVVSGTDRLIVRGLVRNSPLNVPNRQIIGSDELLVASHQGDEDGLKYTFTDEDELILAGEFIIKNLKMNKVTAIVREVGQQPVLSFGNSTGDAAMAEYVTSSNPYPSLAFMLCCDDLMRENGNEAKAQKMYDLCAEFGWVPVSMKNDWTTIYGYGVAKK
ncbi:MAG: haloacid dehalogenase-like hydrolase, partial [Oscillospiraceae bacterium]|nr:haloacid dehalogenase-like hydrolase [Oscillospiraceae bacterium]